MRWTRTSRPRSSTVADPRFALTHGWVRLARAGVLGGASLFLATAGHLLGGGQLPGAGLLALVAVGLALTAVSLTTRRVRFLVLLAVLTVEQAALHLIFHAATSAATCVAVTMPGHAMPTAAVCSGSTVTAPAGWPMLLGHAIALLISAWLLARGERWLWRTIERIHHWAAGRPGHLRRPRPMAVSPAGAIPLFRVCWAPAGPRGPPVV